MVQKRVIMDVSIRVMKPKRC